MNLKVKLLEMEARGNLIVVMNEQDADKIGVKPSDRITISVNNGEASAILNLSADFPKGYLGVYREVKSKLGLREGDNVQVKPSGRPESLAFVREKILGERLTPWKIEMIIKDVVEHHLSDIELAAFVTSLQINKLSMEEIEAFSKSMIKSGKTINFRKYPILDKHSIGGVPGDKTTILVVPIVASAGYTIPKSSSRAITSPAGTADRVENLCPVNLRIEEIIEVVEKVNACMVWGGALDLAPADDLFIRAEYPLSIDPLLLPSIISKKKAMGSTHIVVDIPIGEGAKIKTIDQANQLAMDFIELGERLDMNIECAITEGKQPIGYAVGPALEAKEALEALMGNGPADLVEKAITLAAILFEMVGEENPREKAFKILKSGKAEKKLREIIEAQGGNPEIKPEDIRLGSNWSDIESREEGRVLWMNCSSIAQIAKTAGAPVDKGAGIILRKKIGDEVKRGDVLFRVFSENPQKLEAALKLVEELKPIEVGRRIGEKIMIKHIKAVTPLGSEFILER